MKKALFITVVVLLLTAFGVSAFMIGNYLVDESLDNSKKLFHNYTFVRYFFAMIFLAATFRCARSEKGRIWEEFFVNSAPP